MPDVSPRNFVSKRAPRIGSSPGRLPRRCLHHDPQELDRWLGVYGRAWERKDVGAFVACFTDDAVLLGPMGRAAAGLIA